MTAAAGERVAAFPADAACAGMPSDIFFPERSVPGRVRPGGGPDAAAEARAVCRGCPVRAACLEAGLWERWGVWGGTTEKERRVLRRARAAERPDRRRADRGVVRKAATG